MSNSKGTSDRKGFEDLLLSPSSSTLDCYSSDSGISTATVFSTGSRGSSGYSSLNSPALISSLSNMGCYSSRHMPPQPTPPLSPVDTSPVNLNLTGKKGLSVLSNPFYPGVPWAPSDGTRTNDRVWGMDSVWESPPGFTQYQYDARLQHSPSQQQLYNFGYADPYAPSATDWGWGYQSEIEPRKRNHKNIPDNNQRLKEKTIGSSSQSLSVKSASSRILSKIERRFPKRNAHIDMNIDHEKQLLIKKLLNIPEPKVTEIKARSVFLVHKTIPNTNLEYEHEVLISNNGKEGKYTSIFIGASKEYYLGDLTPHTEYHILVLTVLKSLNLKGSVSDTLSFETNACKPDQPTPPKLTKTKTSVQLQWNTPNDNGEHIKHFILESNTAGTSISSGRVFTAIYKGPANWFDVPKLLPSTLYNFRLIAVNELGESRPSEIISFTTQRSAPSQPFPPSCAEITESTLHLFWSKRPSDEEFMLEMDDTFNGCSISKQYIVPEVEHIVTGLRANTSYTFKLRAYNEVGVSQYSSDVSFKTKHGRPGQPLTPVVPDAPWDEWIYDYDSGTSEVDDPVQNPIEYRIFYSNELSDEELGVSYFEERRPEHNELQSCGPENSTEVNDIDPAPAAFDYVSEISEHESVEAAGDSSLYEPLLEKLNNLQITENVNSLNTKDQSNVSRASSPEPADNVPHLYVFKNLTASPNKTLMFSGGDVKIISKHSKMIRLRYCPPTEYNNFTESIKREEGLCVASPIIQIEDFQSFFSHSCKEILIRHNIYSWEQHKKCYLRSYSNLQDLHSYVDIEAEMCKDYIKVCGNNTENGKGGRKRCSSESSHRQQRNESGNSSKSTSSSNSSNDEGYAGRDESPKLTTCSLVHIAKHVDICDVRLYFTREIQNNTCPLPHEMSVYTVLDKDKKIQEFLEKELPECGTEQGAQRIRVAIFKDQVYTPILGESPKTNPKIVWDENNPFGSFSYSLLNQKRGFLKLQKTLPPLMLYCDRRKYFMMKLKLSSKGKPPDDHIFIQGAEIVPRSCEKFCGTENLADFILAPSYSDPPVLLASSLPSPSFVPLSQPGDALNMAPPQVASSFAFQIPNTSHTEINTFPTSAGPSSITPLRKCAKGPSKTRRNKNEIDQGSGGLKCPHCPHTLTRPQTLRAHVQKFHPTHSTVTPVMNRKGKGKDKKNSEMSTFPNDALSLCVSQQVGQHTNCFQFQDSSLYNASLNYSINAQGLQGTEGMQRNVTVEEIETMKGVQGMYLTNGIPGSMGCQETEDMPGIDPLPLPGMDCLVAKLLGTN